jgi:hypothetical protein
MKNYIKFISMRAGNFSIALVIVMLCASISAHAQGDGARFYWKGLMGTNAVPVIVNSMGGNANPLDPAQNIIPGSNFEATMSMAGYARMLPIGKRPALISVIVPMGRIAGEATIDGLDYSATSRGFGDPMVMLDINVIGPKAITNIPEMLRYKPGFSVDILGSLAIPIGAYDNTSPINLGQNRWYGRIGTPVVWQIGQWIPGKRTTFEMLPAVWFMGDNNDFMGKTMETKPKYQLEAHLTRDFMERIWGSLDVISYTGGKSTIDGVEGSSLSNIGMGGTLGYQVNDNMQLTLSYNTTVNDKNPEDLKMDGFRIVFLYGWHPLIEGMRRLKGNE